MGISGLLPLLKSIQVKKHLSEFAGQTLAVDAYVWLHRGVYACAPEIATGKATNRYVDYAMHRVRLLRHHHIHPYIVFDGGPLPAKKGTEVERKRRRDENLARGNALAAQGKHSQAREYYVKCVDVTPQMAFQFIKALRAESVPYVVAPYEADAQLAYLEKIGLVDGIITEDSDLLVFGCRTVLFKLDDVTSTITSISRSDFASVTTAEGGISLLGWSDVQFRAMAILSGCDYLPSIPGIGLKTAWSLLRKYKTAENVIKAVRLEGKKPVPQKYLQAYKMAECVFLYQRVYDTVKEKLVYLTEVPDALDEETEAYVGSDIEASLAKEIALGNYDPVSHTPMEDINPTYIPRPHKFRSLVPKDPRCSGLKGKGKTPEKLAGEGILGFFPVKPKVPLAPEQSSQRVKGTMVVGRASGKRTLADIMDQDLALASKKGKHHKPDHDTKTPTQSRFFGGATPSKSIDGRFDPESIPVTGPSCLQDDKENVPPFDEIVDLDTDLDLDISMEVGLDIDEPLDTVIQEDGYLSPSPVGSRWDTPDVSSPLRPARQNTGSYTQDVFDFGADVVSSPPATRKRHSRSRHSRSLSPAPETQHKILVPDTPVPKRPDKLDSACAGPDLRGTFGDDLTSEIDCFDEEGQGRSTSTSPCDSVLVTPEDSGEIYNVIHEELDLEFNSAEVVGKGHCDSDPGPEAIVRRTEIVANGWRNRWAFDGKAARPRPMLRRRETTVTPTGRHKAIRPLAVRTPAASKVKANARTSLVFFEEVNE